MIGSRAVLAVVSVLTGCAACCVARAADTSISKVMGSIDIGAEQHSRDVSTVNGCSVVGGTLRFERKVNLYVSERATIGRVEGATAVRFSGDRPPG